MKTTEVTRRCRICGKVIKRKPGENNGRYNRREVCWLPLSAEGKKQISPCERKAMGGQKRTPEQKAKRKADYKETKLAESRRARADKWESRKLATVTDYVGAACSVADLVGPDSLAAWMPAPVRTLSRAEIMQLQAQYQPPIGRQRIGATVLRREDR